MLTAGKSALETVLTVLHAGGKFGGEGSGYKVCLNMYCNILKTELVICCVVIRCNINDWE
jgi:DNA gyrase/topoisomerase IV subunit B